MATQQPDTQEQDFTMLGARLPSELHARFDAICTANYRSKSATIQMLIEQYCDYTEQQLSQGS